MATAIHTENGARTRSRSLSPGHTGRTTTSHSELPLRPRRDPWRVHASTDSLPPRKLLYERRYVPLDEYRRDLARGAYRNLRRDEKMKLFGSTIVPIHVPLAPGETKHEYEARFHAWVAAQGLSVEELARDADENLERYYRFNFATENARGTGRFDSSGQDVSSRKRPQDEPRRDGAREKHARTQDGDATKAINSKLTIGEKPARSRRLDPLEPEFKCSIALPAYGAPAAAFAAAYSACGCRQCLAWSMEYLATVVTQVEAKQCVACAHTETRRSNVVDLTAAGERDLLRRQGSLTSKIDTVEMRLLAAYNEINEQLTMNESAVAMESAQLMTAPMTDIHETTQLHDENVELLELIRGEAASRNVALAMLIVYVWRHEKSELERMVRDPAALDVALMQRACHGRCADIAATITQNQTLIAKASHHPVNAFEDVDKASASKRLKETLTQARVLQDQRRSQFRLLIHCDAALRQLVQTLLVHATSMAVDLSL